VVESAPMLGPDEGGRGARPDALLLLLDPLVLFVLAMLDMLQVTALPSYAALSQTAHWDGEAVSAALGVGAVATMLLFSTALVLAPRRYLGFKRVALTVLVLLLVVAPMASRAYLRYATGHQLAYAHDGGVVQTEESARFLLRGVNPYSADYYSTPLRGVVVPGILHYNPYLPASFLLSAPLIALADAVHVPFDQRVVYLALYAAGIWLIPRAFRNRGTGELARTIFAFNPLVVTFLVEGRNDIYTIAFLLFAIVALERRRPIAFFAALALACATKQLAWFVAPFLLVCSWRAWPREVWRRGAALGAGLFVVTVLPFFVWNPGAFVNATYKFNAGLVPDSYPLGGTPGFGFAMLAAAFHWAPNRAAYFELTPYVLVTALPLAILLLRRLARRPSTAQALLGAFVVSFWIYFFSRVFHNNYLSVLSFLLQMGLLAAADDVDDADDAPAARPLEAPVAVSRGGRKARRRATAGAQHRGHAV
jgi:hypothetical protein